MGPILQWRQKIKLVNLIIQENNVLYLNNKKNETRKKKEQCLRHLGDDKKYPKVILLEYQKGRRKSNMS